MHHSCWHLASWTGKLFETFLFHMSWRHYFSLQNFSLLTLSLFPHHFGKDTKIWEMIACTPINFKSNTCLQIYQLCMKQWCENYVWELWVEQLVAWSMSVAFLSWKMTKRTLKMIKVRELQAVEAHNHLMVNRSQTSANAGLVNLCLQRLKTNVVDWESVSHQQGFSRHCLWILKYSKCVLEIEQIL